MSSTVRFIIFVCIAGASIAFAATRRTSSGRTCQLSRTQADRCASAVITFSNHDAHFPTNPEETVQFCRSIENGIKCLSRYRYCVSGFKRSLLKVFVSFMKSEVKEICSEDISPFFTRHTFCLSHAFKPSNDFFKCSDRFVLMMDFILEKVPSDDKVLATCCAYVYYRRCLQRFTNHFCSHLVSGEVPKYLDNFFERAAKILPSCSAKYNSPDSCAAHLAVHSKKFEEISSDDDVLPQNRTVLLTLLDIFDY